MRMAVEHMGGRDLGEVYTDFSGPQKTALAREIVQIQKKVARLGEGDCASRVWRSTVRAQLPISTGSHFFARRCKSG